MLNKGNWRNVCMESVGVSLWCSGVWAVSLLESCKHTHWRGKCAIYSVLMRWERVKRTTRTPRRVYCGMGLRVVDIALFGDGVARTVGGCLSNSTVKLLLFFYAINLRHRDATPIPIRSHIVPPWHRNTQQKATTLCVCRIVRGPYMPAYGFGMLYTSYMVYCWLNNTRLVHHLRVSYNSTHIRLRFHRTWGAEFELHILGCQSTRLCGCIACCYACWCESETL